MFNISFGCMLFLGLEIMTWVDINRIFERKIVNTRGDQKVCEKVLLYRIAFMDCNERNSQS